MKKSPFFSIKKILNACFTNLFGKVHWSSPPWIAFMRRKATENPLQLSAILIIFFGFLATGIYSYQWYKNLPQPQRVKAFIATPTITPIGEELIPSPLIIDFGIGSNNESQRSSVAPINLIGKKVEQGIDLSPSFPGSWMWESDSRLVFTPSKDWPARQTFKVHFAKEAFAPNAPIESLTYSFITEPFQAKISEFKFYQDPVNPKVRNATATINFNFPVDAASLEANTTLMLQALKNNQLDYGAEQYKFNYTYDKHKRTAYLHSENLGLPNVSRYLALTLSKGVRSSTGSDATESSISQNLLIPDASNYFKIKSVNASIVRNDQDRPEQVLAIETSLGVTDAEINKSVHFYLLPQNYPATAHEEEKTNYQWQNPGEVTKAILALSTPLQTQALPTERHYSMLHSYKFNSPGPRSIYVKIDKGFKGFGDFTLSNDYTAVIPVPELPKEISFLHKGALLSLNSEKKLSVLVRGLPSVKFQIARVLPQNVNQLVTQTEGDFNNPYFINQSFNQENISEIYSEIRHFDASDLTKQQYTALDFTKYLTAAANQGGPRGLFLLQATGWDPVRNEALEAKTSRLILITDLALVVKDNNDGSHDVFVQSITQGGPAAYATVTILGKNGLPILTRTTDNQGRANFPSLKDFIDDREPTVYLASFGNDVSFIPYNKAGRQLNYSRYDIGGIYNYNQELHSLGAYIFTDRGIYRPGDEVNIGVIVKQAYAQPQPPGLPLEVIVTDPRGTTALDKKYSLDATGYTNFNFKTNPSSPTGQYTINLFIIKDGRADSLLGSTSINVSEFQPDRMRITSSFNAEAKQGWISPEGLKATVSLWNLYGAPAADRKISAKLVLAPQGVKFAKYPDYIFADPLLDSGKPAKVYTDNLADVKTNEQGQAQFDLNLQRFDKATYQLSFFAEGFEAEGGRSVTAQSTALVSPLPYFIGYKADGDLNYIKQNSARSVNFIAVNSQLNQEQVEGLKVQLVSLHPVSTLVKKPDGTYQYQSIIQSSIINTKPFIVTKNGTNYAIPTQQIGDFALIIVDKDNTELSKCKFSVVGASQRPLAKNAELNVKLNKEEYKAGEDIELQITAPYTGAGLITIERDKVYAVQWFKTNTTSSVQKIHIPEDFQGNGYVNVTFARDWESPDIFISPLSYSVNPFKVNHESHTVHINLETPNLALPGMPVAIRYKTDKPGKIIVFAVDEGILQVSHYKTPDPLGYFFQKHALEVVTQQTVDQILPKFVKTRELSAVGGDGSEELLTSHLNPFKRKTDLPVVFWSGILDSDGTPREVSYQIPDYFNGSLRVMAVAVSNDAVGATDKKTEVRGYFVINPNAPNFVAPEDVFEITASIANNLQGSGQIASIDVELSASPELEVLGSSKESLIISEGKEKTVRFKLRAKSSLGSAKINLIARSGNYSSRMDVSLSIRPATAYNTSIISGRSSEAKKVLPIMKNLYPEYKKVEASLSTSPLILVAGLQRYLDGFPYGCTEQLTSKAFPLLAMSGQSWLVEDANSINDKVMATIQMLRQRQMSNGAFSYWPGLGENASNNFISVYAMHFLTEAKEQGYNVPNDLYSAGLAYLKELASQNPTSLDKASTQAYAIYILTRNELVTTNYLTNLQLYLDKEIKLWQQNIIGAYVAATYQLLKSSREANQLIGQYKSQVTPPAESNFFNTYTDDAQYLYLLAKHFPQQLAKVGDKFLIALIDAMNKEMNTVLSGYGSLALSAYGQAYPAAAANLSLSVGYPHGKDKTLPAKRNNYLKLLIENDANRVQFNNPARQTYFYQLSQAGFNIQPPSEAVKNGIEVYREYRDKDGNVVNNVTLGSEITVHLQVRALTDSYLSNVAIVDLLPGGFEVVRESVKNENMDYADIREDRVIFFGYVDATAKEIAYKIKAINPGSYTLPAAFAESMYDPKVKANSVAGTITVTK